MLTKKRLLYAGAIELAGAVRGLWLAGLGWDVTGYDMANDALSVARANAARAGVGDWSTALVPRTNYLAAP